MVESKPFVIKVTVEKNVIIHALDEQQAMKLLRMNTEGQLLKFKMLNAGHHCLVCGRTLPDSRRTTCSSGCCLVHDRARGRKVGLKPRKCKTVGCWNMIYEKWIQYCQECRAKKGNVLDTDHRYYMNRRDEIVAYYRENYAKQSVEVLEEYEEKRKIVVEDE